MKSETINPEVRFFGVLKDSPAFHFYLLQLVGFAYPMYRLLSRDYTVYGLPDPSYFNNNYSVIMEIWPIHFYYLTTFQFIYLVLPLPGVTVLYWIQILGIVLCLLGLLGIKPRWSALGVFLIASHFTGLMMASNAPVEGGALALVLLLILFISPKNNFYRLGSKFRPLEQGVHYHWPIFILFIFVGFFYTQAGINKIFDVGPHWPIIFHLEKEAAFVIERSLFVSSRYVNPFISHFFLSYSFSVVCGFVTLTAELFFISIIWLPRYRGFFVFSMITMHVLVFLMSGINFVGSSFILLLCFDYNTLVRKVTVYYDQNCGFCIKTINLVKKWDWFSRLSFLPISVLEGENKNWDHFTLTKAMGAEDENGEQYYGADAFEQIACRCPALYPIALLMKIPGIIYIARVVYSWVAKNRGSLGCKLPAGVPKLPN